MKQKEINNLAKKIAQQERKLQEASSTEEKSKIEAEIVKLCSKVKTVEDMVAVDDAVQELLLTK